MLFLHILNTCFDNVISLHLVYVDDNKPVNYICFQLPCVIFNGSFDILYFLQDSKRLRLKSNER